MTFADILNDPKNNPTLADIADLIDEIQRILDEDLNNLIDREGTDAAVTNTTDETEFYTHTVAANNAGTDRMYRLQVFGEIANGVGAVRDITFKLKLGGSTAITFTQETDHSGESIHHLIAYIQPIAKTNNVRVFGHSRINTKANPQTTSTRGLETQGQEAATNTLSTDTTSAWTISLTAQHEAASASLTYTMHGAYLERI